MGGLSRCTACRENPRRRIFLVVLHKVGSSSAAAAAMQASLEKQMQTRPIAKRDSEENKHETSSRDKATGSDRQEKRSSPSLLD